MTLIELSMAVALSSGVALAIGLVVRQMSGAVISIEKRSESQAEAALALHRLRSELRQAAQIVTLGSTKITFEHPDVTGDGQPDLVSYSWANVAGQPLSRTVNGGTAESLVASCTVFRLSAASGGATADLLASHDMYAENVVFSSQQFTLTDSSQAAEVFTLSPGSGSIGCRVEKVRVYLRALSTSGVLTLELRGVSGGNPTGSVLDSAVRPIAQISTTGGWEELQLTSGSTLGAGQYALVLRTSGSTATVSTTFDQITVNPPGGSTDFYRYTSTGGIAWLPSIGLGARDLKYYVYGRRLDGSGSPLAPSGGAIGLVEIHLETGSGASATLLDTAVQCMNTPELAG
jgi:hypothetical protein